MWANKQSDKCGLRIVSAVNQSLYGLRSARAEKWNLCGIKKCQYGQVEPVWTKKK